MLDDFQQENVDKAGVVDTPESDDNGDEDDLQIETVGEERISRMRQARIHKDLMNRIVKRC